MSFFPDDVMGEILSRLPVKPLLRFRSVCKPWCALVDSPVFIKLHSNKTKELQCHRKLIKRGLVSDFPTVDFDSVVKTNIADVVVAPNPFGKFRIVSCCYGLVCVSIPDGCGLAIWNPSTRRHQILPDFGYKVPFTNRRHFPCRYFCGFGYDVGGDDYKVLVIKQFEGSMNPLCSQVYVYSLKMNSWRRIKPFPYCLRYDWSDSVTVCGAVHWVVGKTRERGNQCIASFDLATEEYGIVPEPDYSAKINCYSYLTSLGGCLSVTWVCDREYIDVWVLKEYGKQDTWSKITRIEASELGAYAFGRIRTIGYSVTEKELMLQNTRTNSLTRYDIENKLTKDVEIRGQIKDPWCYMIYEESLVQLKNAVLVRLRSQRRGKRSSHMA